MQYFLTRHCEEWSDEATQYKNFRAAGQFFKALLFFLLLTSLTFAAPKFHPGAVILDDFLTEQLNIIATPLVKRVLPKGRSVRLIVIMDRDVNAFASSKDTIAFHSELIRKCPTAAEFVGVLAHELGHLRAGHPVRGDAIMRQGLEQGATVAALGGVLAAVAGNPEVLIASLAGGMAVAERDIMKSARGFEGTADEIAIQALVDLKWPTQGLVDFMKKLRIYDRGFENGDAIYLRTHPLTQDRLTHFQARIEALGGQGTRSAALPDTIEAAYARVRTLIIGLFGEAGDITSLKRAQDQQVARALQAMMRGDSAAAVAAVGGLDTGSDPHLIAIAGQIFFDAGNFSRAQAAYAKVVRLRPHWHISRLEYGQILLADPTPAHTAEAVRQLAPLTKNTLLRQSPSVWRLAAQAYGRTGDHAMADRCLTEEAMLLGDKVRAGQFAHRASKRATSERDKVLTQDLKAELEAMADRPQQQ